MSEPPRATLHLRVLGETHKVSVEVPATPARVEDILPAARAITDATLSVALEKSATAGAPAACRRGCAACCHQLVAVTIPEARALARLVNAMPPERQSLIRERFAETARRARKLGIAERASTDYAPVLILDHQKKGRERYFDLARRYHAMARPCGFLDNGECGIYENRPLICREYIVSSNPDHCAKFDLESITPIDPPVKLSEALSEITARAEATPAQQIPLYAALAWAERPENKSPAPHHSGVDLLKLLALWIDSKSTMPIEQRSAGQHL